VATEWVELDGVRGKTHVDGVVRVRPLVGRSRVTGVAVVLILDSDDLSRWSTLSHEDRNVTAEL
jgi:hypothetical protein